MDVSRMLETWRICQEKDPALCRMFLVEGTARVSAKQGPVRAQSGRFCLLKGKITDVERASI